MPNQNHAETQVLEIHPDGRRAVVVIKGNGKSYYHAFGPDGLSVGVYDVGDEAKSAAQWAWDFQEEDPAIRRLTLMQLIVDKLVLQYPLDAADVTLAPKA
ncbi:hypothetical protein [Pollutimonas bauzanensis]|uniref:Uncharacterized protein n=1 Tax=Pollutimonas bauzanensis TaxID=658167 RepID=A0A1M5ZRE8_9BURK|nr:hypothetical protein [Pollutimonas bauzanensis]SHI26513.1 hypothetical protein SAMN04488135_11766 [Pollutimonas bauzanensis]